MKRLHTRSLAVALAVLVVAAAAQAQLPGGRATSDPRSTDVTSEQAQLPGVKSQTAWTHRADQAGALGEGYRSSSVSFDRDGNPLEQLAYDENGTVLQKVVNTYDDERRLIESVSEEHTGIGNARTVFAYEGERIGGTTAYRLDGSLLVATSYVYDGDGNVLSVLTEVPDADISQRIEWEYSADGGVIDMVNYDSAGSVVVASRTVSDGDGRPLESTSFLPDGTVGTVTSHEYDSDGQLLEIVARDAEGTVLQIVSRVYDLDGQIVELVTANPLAGIEQRVVVEYDEVGKRLTEQTYNKLGQLVSETRYEYEYYEVQGDAQE